MNDYSVLSILVLLRLAGLMLAIPSLHRVIPRRMQIFLAIAITTLVVPILSGGQLDSLPSLSEPLEVAIAMAKEALVGLLMGTTVQLIITGLQIGAEVTSSTGALQSATSTDEQTGERVPTLAKFVGLMVVAVMFAAGGHRIVLSVLLDSFHRLPPGRVVFHDAMMQHVIEQLTAGMAAGIRFAAPVVAALILTNLATGFISRAMPQFNVFAVGLSVNALALLVVTAITIGSAGLIFQDELAHAAQRLGDLW